MREQDMPIVKFNCKCGSPKTAFFFEGDNIDRVFCECGTVHEVSLEITVDEENKDE
jgi:hypothetical protein